MSGSQPRSEKRRHHRLLTSSELSESESTQTVKHEDVRPKGLVPSTALRPSTFPLDPPFYYTCTRSYEVTNRQKQQRKLSGARQQRSGRKSSRDSPASSSSEYSDSDSDSPSSPSMPSEKGNSRFLSNTAVSSIPRQESVPNGARMADIAQSERGTTAKTLGSDLVMVMVQADSILLHPTLACAAVATLIGALFMAVPGCGSSPASHSVNPSIIVVHSDETVGTNPAVPMSDSPMNRLAAANDVWVTPSAVASALCACLVVCSELEADKIRPIQPLSTIPTQTIPYRSQRLMVFNHLTYGRVPKYRDVELVYQR